jgi:NAD(P)-dependent dehydrogenase (short-subunit alcohol dehydrogenase family)
VNQEVNVKSLTGKTFIITGAGGAIASAINSAFHQAGANLALADRPANAERAREQLNAGLAVPADLSSLAGAQAMLKATLEHYGRVDGLIHTVGGFATGKVVDSSLEQYDQMFDLNVRTLVHAVTVCLPAILETGGFIGGISAAQVARGAGGGVALYAAAKAAVALYLKSLEVEVREAGCNVGVVYPMGTVDTPANRRDMPNTDPNTWIDPNEIGAAFVHMATRSSRGRTVEMQVFPSR